MSNKDQLLQNVIDARETLSQGIDAAQVLRDANDQLNVLKTSYQIATTYVPDKIKRDQKLYLIDSDKYMNMLNTQRINNLYQLKLHKNKVRVERDRILHKRQEELIAFQKYSLVHGRVYSDNIIVIDKDFHVVNLTASKFSQYIQPYQQFLQDEFKRLRPDIKK